MRFKQGESVVCVFAPWHSMEVKCAMYGYGPKKNEVVTVDSYCHHKYFKCKEYPDPEQGNQFSLGWFENYFEPLVSEEQLEFDLKKVQEYEQAKS